MGEQFAGVDPERVAQAAGALEKLRDALSTNVPIITSTMASYGADVNLAPLRLALGRAPGEAADMRARARLAAIAAATPGAVSTTGMVSIPWDHQSVDQADAQAEAQALAAAEASKDPTAARAAIQAIGQDLADHQHDAAFLSAFWSQPEAAGATAALAATLHDEDGNGIHVLSGTDTGILRTYASSLAAACSLPPGTGLSTQQSAALVAAFTAASQQHPWSAAMLLASGPDGHAYGQGTGAQVLGSVTASLLNAERSGSFSVPMDWQQLLSSGKAMDGGQVDQALARFDPTMALLRLDASNQAAAAYTLSGPDGPAIAHQLMTWQFMHYANISYDERGGLTAFHDYTGPQGPWDHYQVLWSQQAIGAFLTAAVSVPRGDTSQAQWSAAAAVNMIKGLPPATGAGSVSVSQQAQAALSRLMTNYRFDLAYSALFPSSTGTQTTSFGSAYGMHLTSAMEQNLIQQALRSPAAFGAFLAQVRGDIGTAAVIAVKTGSTQELDYESALAGLLQRAQNGFHFDSAEQAAAAAAENQEMASILQGGFGVALGFIPGGGLVEGAVDTAEMVSALSGPVVASSLASSSDPAQALQDGDNAFYDLKSSIWVPIANALIAHQLVPPPPAGQNPAGWVAQQLAQRVQKSDQAEVDRLQAALAGASPNDQDQIREQIDKLQAQIGAAANLYDSLVGRARDVIGSQQ